MNVLEKKRRVSKDEVSAKAGIPEEPGIRK
jgi:hypothetical protein